MKKMFADAGLVAKHTNKQRGVVEGATRAYEGVKNDPSARAAGVAEGSEAVNAKVEAEKRAAAEKAARLRAQEQAARSARIRAEAKAREAANKAAAEKRAADDAASAVSKGGTHSGGTIDTDF